MIKHIQNIEESKNLLKKYLLSLYPNAGLNELSELIDQFKLDKFEKKEITNWFIKENMMFAATYSILTGNSNYSTYEALEETYVLKIKYDVLESFYTKYHTLEHLGRKIIEAYYGAFMKKTYDVLFLSAEERYQLFVKDHGDLLNRVPLRFVASFLGITQETLSRLRAKH